MTQLHTATPVWRHCCLFWQTRLTTGECFYGIRAQVWVIVSLVCCSCCELVDHGTADDMTRSGALSGVCYVADCLRWRPAGNKGAAHLHTLTGRCRSAGTQRARLHPHGVDEGGPVVVGRVNGIPADGQAKLPGAGPALGGILLVRLRDVKGGEPCATYWLQGCGTGRQGGGGSRVCGVDRAGWA